MNQHDANKQGNRDQLASERRRDAALPPDLSSLLTQEQVEELDRHQRFGWFVKFARKLPSRQVQLVLGNPTTSRCASIHADGSIRPFYNTRAGDYA